MHSLTAAKRGAHPPESSPAKARAVLAAAYALLMSIGIGVILSAPAGASPIRLKDLVEFDGVRGNDILAEADIVAASTGSACHEGDQAEPSAVLTAMGLSKEQALGAIRLSVGETTTKEDIERATSALQIAYERVEH